MSRIVFALIWSSVNECRDASIYIILCYLTCGVSIHTL